MSLDLQSHCNYSKIQSILKTCDNYYVFIGNKTVLGLVNILRVLTRQLF